MMLKQASSLFNNGLVADRYGDDLAVHDNRLPTANQRPMPYNLSQAVHNLPRLMTSCGHHHPDKNPR